MHLQKPVPMGHCIDGWRVCWLGGWDKQRLFFVVMLVRLQPHPSASVRPSHNDPMELGKVIDALYDSEINCSVSTFWDGGFTVKLGDEMNGFLADFYGTVIQQEADQTAAAQAFFQYTPAPPDGTGFLPGWH